MQTAAAVILTGSAAGQKKDAMYGLIGRIKTMAGKREELAAILLESTREMPGCLSYIVANDAKDADAVWVTEIWETEAAHKASLSLPIVKDAIGRGRPLIAAFDQYHQTEPLGGFGLKNPR